MVVIALLEAGADPSPATTTTTGVQPIHLAAESGECAEVIRAHSRSMERTSTRREVSWGHTPLIFAANGNRVRSRSKPSLDLGADPEVRARRRSTSTRRAAVDAPSAAAARGGARSSSASQEADASEDWAPSPEQVRGRGPGRLAASRKRGILPEDEASPGSPGTVGGWGGLNPLLHAARGVATPRRRWRSWTEERTSTPAVMGMVPRLS